MWQRQKPMDVVELINIILVKITEKRGNQQKDKKKAAIHLQD